MSGYRIVFRKRFDHDLDRIRDLRGKTFDLETLKYALELLSDERPLPDAFHDHALQRDWAGRREFHLSGDDLVIYVRKERAREIVMLRIGTHRQLFRRRLKR